MMAAQADRHDMRQIIAETKRALDVFETRLGEFSNVLDELEAETERQRGEERRRKGWL